MDKSIESAVIARTRKKVILVILLCALLLALSAWLIRTIFKPSLKRSAIFTAVVETGNVENTLNATGEVLPEFEEVISSPISASIQKVLLDAGSAVKAGQSVLTLDKSATEMDYEKMKFMLESKRNSIHKLRLDLDKSYYDLQADNSIKQLRISNLEAAVENARRLLKAGGGTREDVEQAELNLKVAQLEKQQLENDIRSKQQTMQADMRESEIAARVQESDLQALERKLNLASIVASRAGIITWINKNIGANVREGESLVRIADLGSFRVRGSIADSYLGQLRPGMPAIVLINDTRLAGTVVNIHPSVENGIVSFDVQLQERNNKFLRPNLKVDVYLVTAIHNNVLRVANGPAFKGPPDQDIFVIRDGVALRRKVHIGMINFDYVEIRDNVKPGEVVITSDMSEYKHTSEITVEP